MKQTTKFALMDCEEIAHDGLASCSRKSVRRLDADRFSLSRGHAGTASHWSLHSALLGGNDRGPTASRHSILRIAHCKTKKLRSTRTINSTFLRTMAGPRRWSPSWAQIRGPLPNCPNNYLLIVRQRDLMGYFLFRSNLS